MSNQSKLCQPAAPCSLSLFFKAILPCNETQSTRVQAGVKCGVHRCTPSPPRHPSIPWQRLRSFFPRICSIHLHLGETWRDFLSAFICTPTSITSSSSVTVCFALNLLLISSTPLFSALSQSLPFIARSFSMESARRRGSADIREPKSISFTLLFYHLCPFFFALSIQSFLSLAHQHDLQKKKRPWQISFLSDMSFFFKFKINSTQEAMPTFLFFAQKEGHPVEFIGVCKGGSLCDWQQAACQSGRKSARSALRNGREGKAHR